MCVFSSIWTALQSKKNPISDTNMTLGTPTSRQWAIWLVSLWHGLLLKTLTVAYSMSVSGHLCACCMCKQFCVCVCVSETSPDSSFLWPKSYRPPVFDLYDLGPFISGHVSCHVVVSWSCWGYLRVGARWYLQSDADDQTGHVTV